MEIRQLKEKLDNYENEVKFHKRMVEKTNQPYSYMIADIERSEKDLMFSQKKLKQMEEELKRMAKENEQLKLVSIIDLDLSILFSVVKEGYH